MVIKQVKHGEKLRIITAIFTWCVLYAKFNLQIFNPDRNISSNVSAESQAGPVTRIDLYNLILNLS